MSPADPIFEAHRHELSRLAYHLLGSLADADDILQEAYLRWTRESRGDVLSASAYLKTIVTRLCIDRRRAIDASKETYVGPWLPEPIVEIESLEGDRKLETAESVSMALLVVLETLSPVERAAYLMRKIFDYEYSEISSVLQESEANCRQLVSRAERRIQEQRPRFDVEEDEAERLATAFLDSCRSGDLDGLMHLLASDAVVYSDGGGKALAALAPIYGADKAVRFFLGIMKKAGPDFEMRRARVNGQPGFVALYQGHLSHVLTLDFADGRIQNLFIMRNPDKLTHVPWESSSGSTH